MCSDTYCHFDRAFGSFSRQALSALRRQPKNL